MISASRFAKSIRTGPHGTTSASPYTVTGLFPGTTYTFKVEAGDAAGYWSTGGPSATVTTPAGLVTVTASPEGSVTAGTPVTLTAVTEIEIPFYQWYSNTTVGAEGASAIDGAAEAAFSPPTSAAGTVYYYCVVNGSVSNVVGVTVMASDHTITAAAGANGSITPVGAVTVPHGGSQTCAIAPNEGYRIADVRVDGVSVGAVSSYTFENVTTGHTIEAVFAKIACIPPQVITPQDPAQDMPGVPTKPSRSFPAGWPSI